MWGRRRLTTTTKTTVIEIGGGGEGETARPPPTLYYHSPYLPTLYFLSPFLIIRYFVLYSQEMRRGLSLFFWIQALEQVIFQGSQSLNEAIWAQIKSTFSFIFTWTPSEDHVNDPWKKQGFSTPSSQLIFGVGYFKRMRRCPWKYYQFTKKE